MGDQGCAYNQPLMMVFDGEKPDIQPLKVGASLHFVVVDLKAEKDTKRILESLQRCFPVPQDAGQQRAHDYLGAINAHITQQAANAIETGDAARLGSLMNQAQQDFNAHLQPLCPDQLTAPVLQKLLSYPAIQPYILGGKGVGAQGDGSAQLLVPSAKAQIEVSQIIERELSMSCMNLVLEPTLPDT